MKHPQSILITGASSGLGSALALHYAAPGIRLFLGGRNEDRLKDIAAQCELKGASVDIAQIDVLDKVRMNSWISQVDKKVPLDLVIANAGISGGTGGGGLEPQEQAQQIFAVNVYGVNNTIYPALQVMRKRGKGQVAIVASVAGYYGFPGAPAYCASKAAVKVMGEGLRPSLAREGVEVNVICPGYIKTPMTDVNDFPMPFIMNADRAADIIARGLARNKARITFPWPLRWMVWIVANMPSFMTDYLLARLPTKKAIEFEKPKM